MMRPAEDLSNTTSQELLSQFVRSGRSERAFADLVSHSSGLVYNAALRRTGNIEIAEEVTQNVFTILAKKADRLEKHDSLTAWIYQTTKLESAKAMRKEYTRRRKMDEFSHQEKESSTDAQATLPDIIPLLDESLDRLSTSDRKLILGRFFEGKKFRELAADSGKTEAACKVQIKRVLTKLSGWITAKGAVTSTVTLANILGAEIGKAAPVSILKGIKINALAASHSITTSTTLANTIQTMSTAKQVSATIAAVITATIVPYSWQHAVAKDIQSEIDTLTLLQTEHAEKKNTRALTIEEAKAPSPQRTIKSLLAASSKPITFDTMMKEFSDSLMTRDFFGIIRLTLTLSQMPSADVTQMLVDVKEYKGNPGAKSMALNILPAFTGEDPKSDLEAMIAADAPPLKYGDQLLKWAAQDPSAAIKWFEKERAEGRFDKKGLTFAQSPEVVLFGKLISGLAKNDIQNTITIYEGADDSLKSHSFKHLASALVETKEGQKELLSFTENKSNKYSKRALNAAIFAMATKHSFTNDDAVAYMNQLKIPKSDARSGTLAMLAAMGNTPNDQPLAERADWLLDQLRYEEDKSEAIKLFMTFGSQGAEDGLDTWIAEQTSPEIRDSAYSQRAQIHANRGNAALGLEKALSIESKPMRNDAITQVITLWKKKNPEIWKSSDSSIATKVLRKAGLDPSAFISNN